MREATLTAVRFPDPLVLQQGGRGTARARSLDRIVDPLAARIADGDPTLGWEGDPRSALYIDQHACEWVLVRYEADGVFRITHRWSWEQYRSTDIVPAIIVWLVAHDQRRGYDPEVDAATAEARVEMAQEIRRREIAEEAADRLEHGLRRDGVW